MSQSTDAILFYGFCWDDEGVEDFEKFDDDEWPTWLLRQRGEPNPWDSLPSDAGLDYHANRALADRWVADNSELISAWSDAKEILAAGFGVNIAYHCSCDCPMPFVYLTDTKAEASRGNSRRIDPTSMVELPAERLRAFCKMMEIDVTDMEPGWFLVSMWC